MAGRAFLSIFKHIYFILQSQAGINVLNFLDHHYDAILCDSRYVFCGLARGFSVLNFAYSKRCVILFDFCFETLAGIKIISLEVVFGGLVPEGSEIEFPLRGDLGVAQSDFLQKCRNPRNANGNYWKSEFLDIL